MKKAISIILCCMFCFLFALPAFASEYNSKKPEELRTEHLKSESAILINADTGEVLFEKNSDVLRYPASTTKIMTVLLALTMGGDLNRTVTASQSSVDIQEENVSMIPLTAGQEIKFWDLICATKVASGNDGAQLIAETISGSQENFAALMNEAARNYGCTSTNFTNAHGLHNEYHVSTARDLAIIAREAMKNERFREIAAMTSFTVPQNNINSGKTVTGRDNIFMRASSNEEDLAYYYPDAIGIKTGYHSNAGYCYVGAAKRDGISLISVVLKTSSYKRCFSDTIKLFDYGFSQYVSTSIEKIYAQNPMAIDISSFALDDPSLGKLELSLHKLDPLADDHIVFQKGKEDTSLQSYHNHTSFEFIRALEAPIAAGEVVGMLSYTPKEGEEPIMYELLATRSVNRRPMIAPSIEEIKQYAETDPNPFPPISVELVLMLLIPVVAVILLSHIFYKLFTRKKKPKYKQKKRYTTRYYR
ncbi:MAG: D-alanyl-D-alanine carboxypeptidase family protein [Eubacteriales bacterium]|nr:D-alanyl-D-alanine carboxypeptidase family protein [Eubacteriales bacterium]